MSIINTLKKVVVFLIGKTTISDRVLSTISRDWQEINTLIKGDLPSQLKQALIMADRSVDCALKDLVAGQTAGDRLKNAKNLFSPESYDKIWRAHKLRNALVHESGFEAQGFVIKASIANLKSGLRELGVKL